MARRQPMLRGLEARAKHWYAPSLILRCERSEPRRTHGPHAAPHPLACATARLAITTIRLARYSGEAWMSPISLSDGTFTPSSADASNFPASAASSLLGAEHAAFAGAGHRRTDAVLRHGDEHAGDRIARRRVAELRVASLGGRDELDRGDDLALLERRLEQAGEELVGSDLPLLVTTVAPSASSAAG